MVLAALALAGVVGVIVHGYLARPGWVGVADRGPGTTLSCSLCLRPLR